MILQKYKIVFSGSAGAGKTTAIQQLSDVSEATIVEDDHEESHTQALLLMGIDYGEMNLTTGEVLGLYSIPSQDCTEFVISAICKGALGGVILLDHSSQTPIDDLKFYLTVFKENLTNIIVAVTHLDMDVHRLLKNYREWAKLNQHQNVPFFAIDARKKDELLVLIDIIVARSEMENI